MIISNAGCFYTLKATEEAATTISMEFSARTAADIQSVTILSTEFPNDIQASNELDAFLKKTFPDKEAEIVEFNPIYLPAGVDAVHTVLDMVNVESVSFTGMDGSPYTVKTIKIGTPCTIEARVAYSAFPFPTYSEIIQGQQNARLQ